MLVCPAACARFLTVESSTVRWVEVTWLRADWTACMSLESISFCLKGLSGGPCRSARALQAAWKMWMFQSRGVRIRVRCSSLGLQRRLQHAHHALFRVWALVLGVRSPLGRSWRVCLRILAIVGLHTLGFALGHYWHVCSRSVMIHHLSKSPTGSPAVVGRRHCCCAC